MASTRRLAAILAADVEGYSRLMGADEEGTHERLQAHLRELVDPKIAEHRGRIVKNTGDGLLAEFPSVVDAVRCAVEVQRGMMDREPDVPEVHRIRFRIGINLGDVIVENGDIFGDGVNIAARLEALAEPGDICVSRMVRDNVRDKLDYAFEDLGEQQVKNIARPVRVYRVRNPAVPDEEAAPAAAQPLPLPDKPSIAVLPFANMSGDPEQEYFADGMVEEIITALSRIRWLFVIARNSTFNYKGQPIQSGRIRLMAGQPDLSIKHVEVSLRLSPRARVGFPFSVIGQAHFVSRRYGRGGTKSPPRHPGRSGVPTSISQPCRLLRPYGAARRGARCRQATARHHPCCNFTQRTASKSGT